MKKTKFGTFHKQQRKMAKISFPQEFSIDLWKTMCIHEYMQVKILILLCEAVILGDFGLLFVEKSIGTVDNFIQPPIVEKLKTHRKGVVCPLLQGVKKIVQISEFAFFNHIFCVRREGKWTVKWDARKAL